MYIRIGIDRNNENKKDELVLGAPNWKGIEISIEKVSGLETPPYRNGMGDWSGNDGGYMSSQFYSGRVITIEGHYKDPFAACHVDGMSQTASDEYTRNYIITRLPIRVLQPVRFFMPNGITYYTEAYCTNLNMDYTAMKSGAYQITLYCPDAMLYQIYQDGSSDTLWKTAILRKKALGGYETSYDLPVEWNAGLKSNPIKYDGSVPYYPQIVVRGPLTNPRFTSVETQQQFSLGKVAANRAEIVVTEAEPNHAISDVYLRERGLFFSDYGEVITTGGSGKGAKMLITTRSIGEIRSNCIDASSITINRGGANYEVGDKILIDFVTGSNDTNAPAVLRIEDVNEDGAVKAVKLEATGLFQRAFDGLLTISNISGIGSGLSLSATTTTIVIPSGVEIENVTIVDGGNYYQPGDVLYLTGANKIVQAGEIMVNEVKGDGKILNVALTKIGKYTDDVDGDNVTLGAISNINGFGATAKVTTRQNSDDTFSIQNLTILDGGKGYVKNDKLTVNSQVEVPFTISADQELMIDMFEKTVTVSGQSRSYFINEGSDWIYLMPNTTNHIIFESQHKDDNDLATVRWRTATTGA